MSKPGSGHFSGTTGSKTAASILSQNKGESVIISSDGLDLREHPTKYKQMSSKKRKELHKKIQMRTITKAEYKRLDWQRRLDVRRKAGIDSFWDRERDQISLNLPTTRNWSAEQRTDILNHKRPTFNGKSMQSHHTYSVAKYPHLANQGSLIYPVTTYVAGITKVLKTAFPEGQTTTAQKNNFGGILMNYNYTVGILGLKIKSAPSMAKCISIVRKYNPISMADIKSVIESGDYILKTTVISHSGVRTLRKCYDELVNSGAEVEIFERDKPITRQLVSNLIASHRQTDFEVRTQVDAEVAAEGDEE